MTASPTNSPTHQPLETMRYKILTSTRNAGQYTEIGIASMTAAKAIIRASRQGRKLRWQREGDDICAYASTEDMADEDKAIARLRPVE